MRRKLKMISPLTILAIVIVIAAMATWVLPAGKYNTIHFEDGYLVYQTEEHQINLPAEKSTLDSFHIAIPLSSFQKGVVRKPVAVPGSFQLIKRSGQGFIDILKAPLKGIIDSIDIILFLFMIGAFINVFHQTGALMNGLLALSNRMKGKESWLIIILTFLFSFGGASYGMAEETFAFYPVIVPLFLAAGYDVILPVAVLFGGTQLGTLSSFSNPFSTIIASNASGVNWTDGFTERLLMFVLSTAITIGYFVWYAKRVKKDPAKSYQPPGISIPFSGALKNNMHQPLSLKQKWLLVIFLFTFLIMIAGVIFFDWWLMEMSALFLAATIITAIIQQTGEKKFIDQFVKGAESMLAVALIIGVARGVTIVLNDGHISDSILFYASEMVNNLPPASFITGLFFLYILLTLFISSSSGMAVLTMPIIGGLGVMANIPPREIVNAYLFGMGVMGFMSPTGLMLPSVAMVNVSVRAWWRFIYPLMLMLAVLSLLFLIIGVHFR